MMRAAAKLQKNKRGILQICTGKPVETENYLKGEAKTKAGTQTQRV